MPRYYFDYASKEHSTCDDVGTILASVEAAKAEAACAAADWLKDSCDDGVFDLTVSVRTGKLRPLFVVTASIKVSTDG